MREATPWSGPLPLLVRRRDRTGLIAPSSIAIGLGHHDIPGMSKRMKQGTPRAANSIHMMRSILSCRQTHQPTQPSTNTAHRYARHAEKSTGKASKDVCSNVKPMFCGPLRAVKTVASQEYRSARYHVPGTRHQPRIRTSVEGRRADGATPNLPASSCSAIVTSRPSWRSPQGPHSPAPLSPVGPSNAACTGPGNQVQVKQMHQRDTPKGQK